VIELYGDFAMRLRPMAMDSAASSSVMRQNLHIHGMTLDAPSVSEVIATIQQNAAARKLIKARR
jgi:hypothetical protein